MSGLLTSSLSPNTMTEFDKAISIWQEICHNFKNNIVSEILTHSYCKGLFNLNIEDIHAEKYIDKSIDISNHLICNVDTLPLIIFNIDRIVNIPKDIVLIIGSYLLNDRYKAIIEANEFYNEGTRTCKYSMTTCLDFTRRCHFGPYRSAKRFGIRL